MIVRDLICRNCGGKSFSFQMKYNKKEETRLLLCHDGYGFQMEDAFWKCNKCGKVKQGGEQTTWT